MTEFAAETLGAALFDVAWRSTAAVALAYGATRALPTLGASRRREISVLALLVVVVMTIATLAQALLDLRNTPPASMLSRLVGVKGEIQILTSIVPKAAPVWLQTALGLWAAGTMFALVRTLNRMYHSASFVAASELVVDSALNESVAQLSTRVGLSSAPALRQSATIETAAVHGLWTKTILVSEMWPTWSDERRSQILTHELCHIANHDLPATLLAQFARALLWWNPALHLAVRNMKLQQEYVCDEQVVRAGSVAEVYAETLLDLARSSSRRHHTALLAVAESAIPERVERLLRVPQQAAPSWHRWYSRVAVAAALIGLACIPSYRAQNKQITEQVIDMRDTHGTPPGRVRIDRDASGNIRVRPTTTTANH